MKGDKVFLDTNLLLYAYDAGSPAKHAVAVRILEDLWKSGNGILSTQILQEFFVNVTKKIPKPLSVAVGREIVEDFLKWKIVPSSTSRNGPASALRENPGTGTFLNSLLHRIGAAHEGSLRRVERACGVFSPREKGRP